MAMAYITATNRIEQMGAEEDADTAVGAQIEKDIMDLAPAAGVEPVGRLIEYQQLWDADERPCETQALTHALRECADRLAGVGLESNLCQPRREIPVAALST